MLTRAQTACFHERGYLRLSGLIAKTVAHRAALRLAGCSENDLRHPELLACYSGALLATVASLAGGPVRIPGRVWPLVVAPGAAGAGPHPPHIDHAHRHDRHPAIPLPYRVGAIFYLAAVGAGQGATFVWPASHRQLLDLRDSDRRRFRFMWQLQAALDQLDLSQPEEQLAAAGDVLFFHPLLAHAGSANIGAQPRLALTCKW